MESKDVNTSGLIKGKLNVMLKGSDDIQVHDVIFYSCRFIQSLILSVFSETQQLNLIRSS